MSSFEPLLHQGFCLQAQKTPDAPAVFCDQKSLTYRQLDQASDALAAELIALGLRPAMPVGLILPKSLQAVIALLSVLKAGGAYVPVDLSSPPSRQSMILQDCGLRFLVTSAAALKSLYDACPEWVRSLTVLTQEPHGVPCSSKLWDFAPHDSAPSLPFISKDQPAYVLYTSGSTGRPKGVTVSHFGAYHFVHWALGTFHLGPEDRLANHAQLHFDLSVFDLFAALSCGAQLHLVTSELGFRPDRLRAWIASEGITTWYSVPSALTMLALEGGLLAHPPASLHRVLFAGEVFPLPHLRPLMHALPQASFFNLYGPTETNVCTYHRVPSPPGPGADAIPIGRVCDHLIGQVLDAQGSPMQPGEEGELCVAGPSVMLGYWGRAEQTQAAFWPAGTAVDVPAPLYRTGDRVRQEPDGTLWFLGRLDRQIKRRGYRIELGEVEAALMRLPEVREVAVICRPDERSGTLLHALVVPQPDAHLTVLRLKLHCGSLLPAYMVPDRFELRPSLPRTGTGKIDWQQLG